MAKKFSRNVRDEFEDEDYRHDYHQELKERRKNKRMRNALRSNDIDALIYDLDDEFDDDY
jgi:hypothetical protein